MSFKSGFERKTEVRLKQHVMPPLCMCVCVGDTAVHCTQLIYTGFTERLVATLRSLAPCGRDAQAGSTITTSRAFHQQRRQQQQQTDGVNLPTYTCPSSHRSSSPIPHELPTATTRPKTGQGISYIICIGVSSKRAGLTQTFGSQPKVQFLHRRSMINKNVYTARN